MPSDQGALELGDHGVLEAQDSRPWIAAIGQRGQQVLLDFLFDAPFAVAGGSQLADGAGQIMRLGHHSTLRLLSTTGSATAANAPETGSPLGMDSTAPGAPFVG